MTTIRRAIILTGLCGLATWPTVQAVEAPSADATAPSPTSSPSATPEPAATPESARAAMAKWVETQQLIAKETREWQQGREILDSRISLVQGEIAALEDKLKQLRQAGAEGDRRRSDAGEEDASLKRSAALLSSEVAGFETRLREILPRLPDPIRTKIDPLYSRMPADPTDTKVALAERFQNVVGILNEVGKFNNDITMVTEVRTLADGKPNEVRAVYLGLAQAYYVSAGGEAGVGRPAEDGWHWEPVSGLAPKVDQVIEVLNTRAKPKFVALPASVK